MKFIVSGIIKNLSHPEIRVELQSLFLGKELLLNKKNVEITEIILTKHTILFCYKEGVFPIHGVKKIELNKKECLLKIFTKKENFFVQIPKNK